MCVPAATRGGSPPSVAFRVLRATRRSAPTSRRASRSTRQAPTGPGREAPASSSASTARTQRDRAAARRGGGLAADVADRLSTRYEAVRARVAAACARAGRAADDVRLVAVSKGVSVDVVREATALGIRRFGENYVQEWQPKRAALADARRNRRQCRKRRQGQTGAQPILPSSTSHLSRLVVQPRRTTGRPSPLREMLVDHRRRAKTSHEDGVEAAPPFSSHSWCRGVRKRRRERIAGCHEHGMDRGHRGEDVAAACRIQPSKQSKGDP